MKANRGMSFDRLGHFVVRARWWVIGFWIVLAAALNIAFPQVESVVREQSAPAFPPDSPTFAVLDKMAKAFDEDGSRTTVIVVLEDKSGLDQGDEQVLRKLTAALKADTEHVLRVQDFLDEPEGKALFTSHDNQLWYLPVGIQGDIGTPDGNASDLRVRDIVAETTQDSNLETRVTGPPATGTDMVVIGESSMALITVVTGVLITIILLLIYQSLVTALLPLMMIGITLVAARGVAAALGLAGFGVSAFTVAFMTAVLAGAGTDYAVFLISRYHEFVRGGLAYDRAIGEAAGVIGKVIAASAATVALACASLAFTQMGFFATAGPACAIGITLAFLASVTLLPAVLSVAAGKGKALPKRDRTARAWKKVGVTVVRRPVRVLAMSLVLLLGLAVCATFIDVSYDDRSGLPDDLQSNEGYAMLDAHFPKDFVLPQYLVIDSESNMRTPEGLADLEQMAARVAQLPGVTAVRGITRPDGKPLTESSVSYQAGRVGSGLADAANEIDSRVAEFAPMLDKVDQMVAAITNLREMSGPVFAAAVDASDLLDRAGGFDGLEARLAEVQGASDQLEAMNGAIDEFATAAMQLADLAQSVEPLINVLNTSSFCNVDPRCVQLRSQLQRFVGVGDDSLGARVTRLRDAVTTLTGGPSISETLGEARDALASVKSAIVAFGGDPKDPGGLVSTAQGTIGTMAVDAQAFGSRFAELGPAKDQLQSGLQQAADYLLELKNNASSPNMAGFYIPAIVVNSIDFQTAASVFVSADGHTARYLISTEFGAFGDEAIELTGKIRQTAQAAVPNTSLENSTVEVAGATSLTEDVKKYLNEDFVHIIITTLVIVALILVLLLRAVLAPLYLLISVVLSYVSALGLGVIVFQFLLGQELSWMLAPMAFIVLVAVGADYNMLLISRLRDESSRGIRVGVIRTVASTGSVITSAGIIFAASMFGLMAGQFQGMIQIGFVIGTGLLLDTFIVRTVTVPALASLIGRGNWWPSKV